MTDQEREAIDHFKENERQMYASILDRFFRKQDMCLGTSMLCALSEIIIGIKNNIIEVLDAKWRKVMADEIVADRKKHEAFYEAQGMKKAAEEIKDIAVGLTDTWICPGKRYYSEIVMREDLDDYLDRLITEANKTLEAEGDEKL